MKNKLAVFLFVCIIILIILCLYFCKIDNQEVINGVERGNRVNFVERKDAPKEIDVEQSSLDIIEIKNNKDFSDLR